MSGKEIKASSLLVWSYKRGQMVSLLIHVGDRLGLVSGVCVHQVLSTLNLFSLRKNRREGLYYYYYCHRHHDYRIDTYAATHSDCIYILTRQGLIRCFATTKSLHSACRSWKVRHHKRGCKCHAIAPAMVDGMAAGNGGCWHPGIRQGYATARNRNPQSMVLSCVCASACVCVCVLARCWHALEWC